MGTCTEHMDFSEFFILYLLFNYLFQLSLTLFFFRFLQIFHFVYLFNFELLRFKGIFFLLHSLIDAILKKYQVGTTSYLYNLFLFYVALTERSSSSRGSLDV